MDGTEMFFVQCARRVIDSIRSVFLVLANRNRNFRFVKFPIETDRNNWKPIGFGCLSVSVGFSQHHRFTVTKRKKQLNITWDYRFFNKKITTQNHNHRFTENSMDSVLNKTQNTEKREGYREMWPWETENEKIKPAWGGRRVEVATKADLCGGGGRGRSRRRQRQIHVEASVWRQR